MAVKETEDQLLDNVAAMMNASLGYSLGSIALSRRWAAVLNPSHGSNIGLLSCVFMGSALTAGGNCSHGGYPPVYLGLSIGSSRGTTMTIGSHGSNH